MNFARWKLAIPLLLGAFVLGLRALLIGQPPFTDEGVYASMSYLVWHHPFEPLPSLCPISSINVYPWALSWLCALPSGSLQLVAFRAADALLAACCAISIYFLLVELSKNRWIAAGLGLLWTLCTNHPALINAGFKNAYAPGLLCVIWALWLLVRHREDPPLLCIGTLLGMTFLIREPLVVFALPIFVYVVWHLSWRQAVRLTAGAGFTAILGLAGLGLVRGGDIAANLRGILGAWRDISEMHHTLLEVDQIDSRVHHADQIRIFFDLNLWAMGLWIVALAGLAWLPRSRENGAIVVLAALTLISPLPEFFLKLGFPYHLGGCLLGLSMLAALGLGTVAARPAKSLKLALAAGLPACLLLPATHGNNSLRHWTAVFHEAAQSSREFLPVMTGRQSLPDTAASFYLRAAAAIRRHSQAGDTVLVSGFYGGLYVLSDRRPPTLAITDLSTYALSRNLAPSAEERAELNRHLPSLLVETNRFGAFDLTSLIDDFPRRYVLVENIPRGSWHYGGFACKIYRRTAP